MSQNSIIAVGLILGFIVFVTVRGELPQYLGVLGLGSAPINPAPTTTTTANPLSSFGTGLGGQNPFQNNPFVFNL